MAAERGSQRLQRSESLRSCREDEREVRIAAKRSSKLTRAAIAGCSVVAALTLACIALLQGSVTTVNSSASLVSHNQSHLQQQQRSVVALDDYNADRLSSSRAAQNAVADELRQLAATGDYRVRVNIAQVPAAPTIMSVYDREKQLDNVGIDGVVIFDILWKLNYTETIKPYLDAGYKVVLNLEFVETFPNLNATATGRYDKWLYDFAWQVTNDGRPITIRPLHEFNGKLLTCTSALHNITESNTGTSTNWHLLFVLCTDVLAYYRGTYSGAGNSVETFKLAWKYVACYTTTYTVHQLAQAMISACIDKLLHRRAH
eukprot:2530-Heterococcus_DN1.PRE.2